MGPTHCERRSNAPRALNNSQINGKGVNCLSMSPDFDFFPLKPTRVIGGCGAISISLGGIIDGWEAKGKSGCLKKGLFSKVKRVKCPGVQPHGGKLDFT